jgi:CBS domain-containing protein
VVDDGAYVGMIDRTILLAGQQDLSIVYVRDLFGVNVPALALAGETCRTIATRVAVHGLERLPVVTDAQSRRLIGIVSRSDLVKPSQALLNEEHR